MKNHLYETNISEDNKSNKSTSKFQTYANNLEKRKFEKFEIDDGFDRFLRNIDKNPQLLRKM